MKTIEKNNIKISIEEISFEKSEIWSGKVGTDSFKPTPYIIRQEEDVFVLYDHGLFEGNLIQSDERLLVKIMDNKNKYYIVKEVK